MYKIDKLSRIIATMCTICLGFYIVILNTVPISISKRYKPGDTNLSKLLPTSRYVNDGESIKAINSPLYFTSNMPFKFDESSVKVKIKNDNKDQQILLGYQDQESWHYNTKIIDYPLLNSLNWPKIGKGPYLYQKNAVYKNMDDFLKNPPKNKVVGISDYSGEELQKSNTTLPNYQPSNTNTSINVPLRGKTTMYVYLNHESFNMSFTKQDLNWYSDPDAAKISVYKNKDKVFDATIDDDGNDTGNQKPGFKQTVNIKNPGPGLPESGVYKIVIDLTGDSVITNIITNLHKIAFEGPLYTADNHEVYNNITPNTKPTNLITNAQSLSFRSDHNHSTIAKVNQQTVNINKANQTFTATSNTPSSTISIPNSDMIVNGSGYFAFNADQFFVPIPYKILPINSAEDVAQADYILTDYKTPRHEGEWLVAEHEFDLHDAAIQKGQLSWLLSAPGLKENNRTVEYKQIDMILTKKGWFKQ
jgi:hypothetical protein